MRLVGWGLTATAEPPPAGGATGGESGVGGDAGGGRDAGGGASAGQGESGSGGEAAGQGGGGDVPVSCAGTLTFTDPSLEALVRNAIGSPVGPLTADDVSDLTELNAAGHGLAALGGIECLTALEVASLQGNHISDLTPLAELPQLTELNLNGNGLSDVTALAGLSTLTRLSLVQNAVTDLTPPARARWRASRRARKRRSPNRVLARSQAPPSRPRGA